MASSSGDRLRAARLLIRVDAGDFASRLLERETSPGVRARVLGVLRWRRALDHTLEPFLKRPLKRLDPEVREVLRMGCFEAMKMGVPVPVATDAMIRSVRRLGKSSAAGMVNAVLRRATAAGSDALEQAAPDLRCSHPEWLWRRWEARFGARAAELAMAAAQEPAPPWVWFRDDDARESVQRAGVVLQAHPWCPDAWTATTGTAALMRTVGGGLAVVQDPSSQLVARLAVGLAEDGGRALDLCAAPGGKTALMLRLGRWRLLAAGDRHLGRVRRLRRRLETHGECVVAVNDAWRPAPMPGAWDLVLLDAPCSGTGTLRRHPELKWRLRSEAIPEAARRQKRMIRAAVDLLAPGGRLVYATCSVEAEENEAHFETVPDGCELSAMADHLPEDLPWVETVAGGVRILPHEYGDGFTVHAVHRTSSD